MSNLADSAEAAANGRATPFLPGVLPGTPDDLLLDEVVDESAVEARDYWAGVWLRLRRDKLAIAGGVFIILLFFVAFAGAPIAERMLGHGPNEPFLVSGGLDADGLPAGPWTTVGKLTEDGELEEQLFVLGSDSTLARDRGLDEPHRDAARLARQRCLDLPHGLLGGDVRDALLGGVLVRPEHEKQDDGRTDRPAGEHPGDTPPCPRGRHLDELPDVRDDPQGKGRGPPLVLSRRCVHARSPSRSSGRIRPGGSPRAGSTRCLCGVRCLHQRRRHA